MFANLNNEGTSDEAAYAVYDLKQHLSDIKSVFLDPKIAKTILTLMTGLLEKKDNNIKVVEKGNHQNHWSLKDTNTSRNVFEIKMLKPVTHYKVKIVINSN